MTFRLAMVSTLLIAAGSASLALGAPTRGLKVCVAADAPEPLQQAARSVLTAIKHQPLLSLMAGAGGAPHALTDSKQLLADKPEARAFDHLIIVGLLSDPLVMAASEREARSEEGGMYVFGFGHLQGDIGYIESDRNPFLHSRFIRRAPYETEVITITGSTSAGVSLAAESFVRRQLVNGVVAGPGWKRPASNLLDHDPLKGEFTVPDWPPAKVGTAIRVGLTQAGEDEYRGVLQDAGLSPSEIWRVKYYLPGAWDGAGNKKAFEDYSFGLGRRAYGNTVWSARFESPEKAAMAAGKIAAAARLQMANGYWNGSQPPYTSEKESAGALSLWQRGEWVVMSTLPDAISQALRADEK